MTHDHLKALGESAHNQYNYDKPEPELLECFDKPKCVGETQIDISVPEFTSLCPLTGQPDFAEICITYEPHIYCVESKSLKLYMMSYRNHGSFHEECVSTMLNHLVALLEPKFLSITGKFTPRGGIPFHPTVSYWKK